MQDDELIVISVVLFQSQNGSIKRNTIIIKTLDTGLSGTGEQSLKPCGNSAQSTSLLPSLAHAPHWLSVILMSRISTPPHQIEDTPVGHRPIKELFFFQYPLTDLYQSFSFAIFKSLLVLPNSPLTWLNTILRVVYDKPVHKTGKLSSPDGGLFVRRYLLPKVHRCTAMLALPFRLREFFIAVFNGAYPSVMVIKQV